MLYAVNEIFYSLQGEGFHSGKAAVFIRLAGCNLQCPWCDTDGTARFEMSEEDICWKVDEVIPLERPHWEKILIVLTGGEPTIQTYDGLFQALRFHFPENEFAIETNGRIAASEKFRHVMSRHNIWVTISPKIMVENCEEYFNNQLWRGDELKVVFSPDLDKDYIKNLPTRLSTRFSHFYIQPCSGDNMPAVNFVKENPQWKLSLQTQKVLAIQ